MASLTNFGIAARIALLLTGCILLCVLVHGDPAFLGHATNSDTLLPVAYVWDLRNHADTWIGFQLPRIPSLFPDMTLYLALRDVFDEPRWMIFAYSLLQGVAAVVLAGCVIGRMTGAHPIDAALGFLAVLTAISVFNLHVPHIKHLFTMYLPVVHFGSFLMSLLGILLALTLVERWRMTRAVAFTLCVAVAYVSSLKYVIDFIIPLAVATLALAVFGLLPWRRAGAIGLCVVVGMAGGSGVDHLLVRQPGLAVDDVIGHAHRFFVELPPYLASRPQASLVVLVVPYAAMAIGGALFIRRHRRGGMLAAQDSAGLFIWTFATAAVAACIAALAAAYVDDGSFRYAAPSLMWPIIMLAAVLVPAAQRWIVVLAVGQVAAAATAIVVFGGWAGFVPLVLKWQHPLAACLLELKAPLGLKAGLAEYWRARAPTVASAWRIQIDQVTGGGDPYYWGNNRFSYLRSSADPSRPPEYNFFVLTALQPDRIRERYGPPDRVEKCGNDTLWIYRDTDALYRKLSPRG